MSLPAEPGSRPADVTLRASSDDRHRAVEDLRHHFVSGRLDVDEFEDRAVRAYGARTLADLGNLFLDLPYRSLEHRRDEPVGPVGGASPVGASGRRSGSAMRRVVGAPAFRLHASLWLVVSAFWVVAWFGLTRGETFWPVIPIAVTGLSVATHAAVRVAWRR